MAEHSFSIESASPEITAVLAQRLGAVLESGDAILMEGGVGAGKTHFARSLIQSLLSEPEDVPSPTFTLVQTYNAPQFDIWHADLYRLTSSLEVDELGLIDAFETDVCLIEWPDRLGDLAPKNALTLAFETTTVESARKVTAVWTAPKWNAKLKDWANDR